MINPIIQTLCAACLLAGFFLPFLGFWTEDLTTLHLLSLSGFGLGMLAGKGAALLRGDV